MAVDGPPGPHREDVVRDRQRHGGYIQAHRIVDPQPAERGTDGARHDLRHHTAHWKCQQRKDQTGDDIPG